MLTWVGLRSALTGLLMYGRGDGWGSDRSTMPLLVVAALADVTWSVPVQLALAATQSSAALLACRPPCRVSARDRTTDNQQRACTGVYKEHMSIVLYERWRW